MHIKLIFLQCLVCLPLIGRGQITRDPRRDIKGIWAGFSGGADLISNSNLNHWLTNNGIKASSSNDFFYGCKFIVWPKTVVFGADIGQSVLASPKQKTTYFNFLVGIPFRRGRLNIIPLLGIGSSSLVQNFSDTVPPVLLQAGLVNGKLFKERLSFETQLMLFKKIGKVNSLSVAIGCRTYFWQGDWRYIGDNGKVIENSIPNPAVLSPFISVLLGFEAWNLK